MTPDKRFLIINLNTGVRVVPLIQTTILMNSETYLKNEFSQTYLPSRRNEFQIGQSIRVYLNNLIEPLDKKLLDVYKFDVGSLTELQSLPDWIKFSPSSQQIDIINSKQLGDLILVSKIVSRLKASDFSGKVTGFTEAQVMDQLKRQGYLDYQNFLTNHFQTDRVIIFENSTLQS